MCAAQVLYEPIVQRVPLAGERGGIRRSNHGCGAWQTGGYFLVPMFAIHEEPNFNLSHVHTWQVTNLKESWLRLASSVRRVTNSLVLGSSNGNQSSPARRILTSPDTNQNQVRCCFPTCCCNPLARLSPSESWAILHHPRRCHHQGWTACPPLALSRARPPKESPPLTISVPPRLPAPRPRQKR